MSIINLYFYKVLVVILILYMKYIYELKFLDLISNTILQNQKYSSYFDNYINILNRIYIVMYILIEKYKFYQNQKGYLL